MSEMAPFNSGLCTLIAILPSSLPCQDCLAQCTLGGHVYNKDGHHWWGNCQRDFETRQYRGTGHDRQYRWIYFWVLPLNA